MGGKNTRNILQVKPQHKPRLAEAADFISPWIFMLQILSPGYLHLICIAKPSLHDCSFCSLGVDQGVGRGKRGFLMVLTTLEVFDWGALHHSIWVGIFGVWSLKSRNFYETLWNEVFGTHNVEEYIRFESELLLGQKKSYTLIQM